MKLWGMELNRLMKLRNRPGGLQSLWVCGVVLCVALGKLVVWNLWTGEARERRMKELLCNAYLRDNRVLLLRKAGVAGRKMLCEADGMSMLRGDIARDRIKVLNCDGRRSTKGRPCLIISSFCRHQTHRFTVSHISRQRRARGYRHRCRLTFQHGLHLRLREP
jgi:hypothetical protein